MPEIDRDGTAVIHELETQLSENRLSLGAHALARNLRTGGSNFIRNLVIPIVAMFVGPKEAKLAHNGRGTRIPRAEDVSTPT